MAAWSVNMATSVEPFLRNLARPGAPDCVGTVAVPAARINGRLVAQLPLCPSAAPVGTGHKWCAAPIAVQHPH